MRLTVKFVSAGGYAIGVVGSMSLRGLSEAQVATLRDSSYRLQYVAPEINISWALWQALGLEKEVTVVTVQEHDLDQYVRPEISADGTSVIVKIDCDRIIADWTAAGAPRKWGSLTEKAPDQSEAIAAAIQAERERIERVLSGTRYGKAAIRALGL